MARRWMGVALLAGWFGVSASAHAQAPPPPGAPGAGSPPAAAAGGPVPAYGPAPGYGPGPWGGFPPGYPGADCYPPPMPEGPEAPAESLPPNSFSNVHPDLVMPSPRLYIGAEYLNWWVRARRVPPLVTAGNINDAIPGAYGQPGTRPVIGPGGLDTQDEPGGRLTAIYWFDQDHTLGVDGRFFGLSNTQTTRQVGGFGNDNLVLSRPFFDANFLVQNADPLVVPGVQAGSLVVSLPRRFYGADADARFSQCVNCFNIDRITMLVGARFLSLDEKLLISEGVIDLPDSNGNTGNITALHDNFNTSNRFYGGQLGLEGETRVGPVVLTMAGKLAVGRIQQVVQINGDTLVNDPTGALIQDVTRGLLVQPTNTGRFSREQWGVVPEFNLNLAWEFNEHFKASLGYTFLYWSKVVRPGDQIDTTVSVGAVGDPGQFGNSPHPIMPFHAVGFWAQGLTAGLEVSY